jgi:hypothetical protein
LLDLGDCSSDDVSLDRLPNDLRSISKTPSYAFISPGACDDASVPACPATSSSTPTATTPAATAPAATAPAATTPAATTPAATTPTATTPAAGTTAPDQPGGLAAEDAFLKLWVPKILGSPAYARDGALMIVFTATPPAIGHPSTDHPVRTGALILSRFARAGATLAGTYDPYSVLRSVEELFGYTLLGHAGDAKSFVTSALPGA